MRNLFLIITILLILASVVTWLTRAEQEGVCLLYTSDAADEL